MVAQWKIEYAIENNEEGDNRMEWFDTLVNAKTKAFQLRIYDSESSRVNILHLSHFFSSWRNLGQDIIYVKQFIL